MKIRTLVIVFALCLVAFLVARAPMSLATRLIPEGRGLSYSAVNGTIWNGEIRGLAWYGLPIGDLRLDLSALSLLTLSPSADWDLAKGVAQGRGGVQVGLLDQTLGLSDAVIDLSLDQLPLLLPLSGDISASVETLRLGPGGCDAGQARLATDMLRHRPGGIDWQGPPLAGTLTCDAGALALRLAGEDGGESVTIRADVAADLNYDLRVTVESGDEELQRSLVALGFDGEDGIFTLARTGALRGTEDR